MEQRQQHAPENLLLFLQKPVFAEPSHDLFRRHGQVPYSHVHWGEEGEEEVTLLLGHQKFGTQNARKFVTCSAAGGSTNAVAARNCQSFMQLQPPQAAAAAAAA